MRASSMMEVGNPCSLKNEDISDVLEWNLILGADAAQTEELGVGGQSLCRKQGGKKCDLDSCGVYNRQQLIVQEGCTERGVRDGPSEFEYRMEISGEVNEVLDASPLILLEIVLQLLLLQSHSWSLAPAFP